jgi:hypothetical protein
VDNNHNNSNDKATSALPQRAFQPASPIAASTINPPGGSNNWETALLINKLKNNNPNQCDNDAGGSLSVIQWIINNPDHLLRHQKYSDMGLKLHPSLLPW